ncbi:RNA-binding protein [Candidatus Woesearchaeota archaeon CG10_big_fil_rev_8_21_14_0_10_45_16]|nr:MAG: RNA-binding protein [Candidatus Woesearchaeota archaeon CG10_big_fil_rev_8_21_14_0_10_45_16]
MEAKLCSATKRRVDNDSGAVSFNCPQCGQHEVVRSSYARKNAIKYSCPGCGFSGPN